MPAAGHQCISNEPKDIFIKEIFQYVEVLLATADVNWDIKRGPECEAIATPISEENPNNPAHGCDLPKLRTSVPYSDGEKKVIRDCYEQARKAGVRVKRVDIAAILLSNCGTTRSLKAINEKWRDMRRQGLENLTSEPVVDCSLGGKNAGQ